MFRCLLLLCPCRHDHGLVDRILFILFFLQKVIIYANMFHVIVSCIASFSCTVSLMMWFLLCQLKLYDHYLHLFIRSGDSTARIWTIDGTSSSTTENGPSHVVLRHFKSRTNEKSKDVTTLDWNVSVFFSL